MAVEILQLATIIAYLKSQVPTLKLVEGAAQLESAILEGPRQSPAAYVIPIRDEASPNTYSANAARQRVADHFGVVFAIKNLRDARGEAAFDGGLRTYRLAVMTALLGWVPAQGFDLCEYAGGAMIRFANSTLWWQDRYSTAHQNTNP